MDVDVGRQRRNLIAISVALILYKALDAQLGTVKLWGEGVVVSGENVIWIALLALPYMTWRYWLYVKGEHKAIMRKANEYLLESGLISDSFRRLKMQFIKENDITDWELYWDNVKKDVRHVYVSHERHDVEWRDFSLFSSYFGRDELGNYVIEDKMERLPVLQSWLCISSCYIKVVLANKEFSDLYVPYMVAFVAFGWTALGML